MVTGRNGYDYSSKHYSADASPLDYKQAAERIRIEICVSLIGSEKDVLDIGCYDGTIGQFISANKNRVSGIDGSETAVEIALRRGVNAKIGNLEDSLSFPDNSFDVCFAGEIIEHILDTDSFVGEIKRVLRPGGAFVLSTPNAASFGRRLILLFGGNPFFEASYGFPLYATAGHIRFFTKGLLLSYLMSRGFTIEKLTSDVVNFYGSGHFFSKKVARMFPGIGRSLIVKAIVKKQYS